MSTYGIMTVSRAMGSHGSHVHTGRLCWIVTKPIDPRHSDWCRAEGVIYVQRNVIESLPERGNREGLQEGIVFLLGACCACIHDRARSKDGAEDRYWCPPRKFQASQEFFLETDGGADVSNLSQMLALTLLGVRLIGSEDRFGTGNCFWRDFVCSICRQGARGHNDDKAGIQMLMAAEQEAQQIVNSARNCVIDRPS